MLSYEALSLVYKIPDTKVEKKINRLKRRSKEVKEKKENVLLIRFFVPLFRYITTNVKGLSYNEFRLKSDMEKAGIKESPEIYLATGYFYSVISVVACMALLLLTGMSVFLFCAILLGFIFPFYPKSSLKSKIKKINAELLKEFPNFVTTLRYQYGKGKTLNDIVQSYIEVAGPALRYELQKLNAELEMLSDSEALLRFGDRVGLSEVSNFASSLVYGQMYGMDVDSIFAIQEQEMRRLSRDNIMKGMKKKPLQMTAILGLPIFVILIVLAVPPIANMISSLGQF
jgi:pilus assembly protein TadC